jgi:hypothetical protein
MRLCMRWRPPAAGTLIDETWAERRDSGRYRSDPPPVRAPRRLLRPAIWPGATRATWVKRSPSSPRGPSVSPEPHLSMRALHMSRDAGGGQHRGRFQGYDVQRAIGERRGHGSSCRSCPSRARSVPGGLIAPEGLVVADAVDAAHPFPLEEGRIGWGLSLSELCDARPPTLALPLPGGGNSPVLLDRR